MEKKLILVSFAVILLSGSAIAASIGTVPGSIDLGQVERGETIEKEVYITVSDFPQDDVQLQPEISSSALIELREQDSARYATSEEDFDSWVNFQNTRFNTSTTETIELNGGDFVNADGVLEMTVSIPNDAEPGHHYGEVRLNPGVQTGEGGGTLNWGETRPNLHFRVSGNAERQISVGDVRAFRTDEDSAALEVLLSNRGTVTTTVQTFDVNILDSSRNNEATLTVSGGKLTPNGPNSSKWFDVVWHDSQGIDQGTYQIDGTANYMTGSATASGSFSLPGFDVVEVRPEDSPGSNNQEGGDGVPVWFVAIVLSIIGVLMWGFEIEPFWIVSILGILGISAFILLSGVPNFLLVVLLTVVGIIVYGGI